MVMTTVSQPSLFDGNAAVHILVPNWQFPKALPLLAVARSESAERYVLWKGKGLRS